MAKFHHALNGLKAAMQDHSIRLQVYLGIAAVVIGLFLRLDYGEWMAVSFCIGMVIAVEILNTCIERLCDLYTERKDDRIRIIKDMAAAAVLVVSFAAACIGAMILFAHVCR